MHVSTVYRLGALGLLAALAGCNGLYLGDNPRRDVPKETGPLTEPPAGVRAGTAL